MEGRRRKEEEEGRKEGRKEEEEEKEDCDNPGREVEEQMASFLQNHEVGFRKEHLHQRGHTGRRALKRIDRSYLFLRISRTLIL